jgi:hypothetical protein
VKEAAWMSSQMNDAEREALRRAAREARTRTRDLATQAIIFRENADAYLVSQEAAVAASRQLRDILRRTVVKHATLLRQLDEPPERIVVAIKEVAEEAAADAALQLRRWGQVKPLTVQDDLVQWTMDAYYGREQQ